MNQIVFASGKHLIAENLKTEFLTIGAGAVLQRHPRENILP